MNKSTEVMGDGDISACQGVQLVQESRRKAEVRAERVKDMLIQVGFGHPILS
jgi:hypothetical protein